MPKPFPHAYTHGHTVSEDGRVSFLCSQDETIWPWLALNPIHPILVQTINFWGSIESGEVLGTFDPEKWSALLQTDWSCGAFGVGLPVRGTYETIDRDDKKRFELEFFDANDAMVVRIGGHGVVFRTRNFEGWREDTKKAFNKPDTSDFEYVARHAVGVATQSESFLAPLDRGGKVTTKGLITKENGFRPTHPYLGGSGDHVSSAHMGEIGRQFAELLVGDRLINRSGEMVFMHYVELERPFDIELLCHDAEAQSFSLLVRQRARDCTRIDMTYARASGSGE